jgi:hypothetical protein
MGNATSVVEGLGQPAITGQNWSNSATGRHSTPHFLSSKKPHIINGPKSPQKRGITGKKSEKVPNESQITEKIFKEIFPQPNSLISRNTISVFEKEALKGNLLPSLQRGESLTDLSKQCSAISSTSTNSTNNEYELKYSTERSEDLRRSYIAKLITKRIWQPTLSKKDHNSLIIFDWDDTLLCTSFLTPTGLFSEEMRIPEKDLEKINKLESCVYNILNSAIQKGVTYIVTNAAKGWVEYSCARFYPKVVPLLQQLTIVSARELFAAKHPGDCRQWKISTFLSMLEHLDTNLVTNLLCLGDSVIEMEAAHILASKFSHAFIKTVKFRDSPKPEELFKQLSLINGQFDRIFSSIKNLTIRVEKKMKKDENEISEITVAK